MSAIVAIQSANIVADPVVKYTTTGKAVANFRIAVNDGFGDTKKSYFFNATAWEDLALVVGKLVKGQKIGVYGKLTAREYEKDGRKNTVVEILVNALDVRKTGNSGETKPAERPQAQEDVDLDSVPF